MASSDTEAASSEQESSSMDATAASGDPEDPEGEEEPSHPDAVELTWDDVHEQLLDSVVDWRQSEALVLRELLREHRRGAVQRYFGVDGNLQYASDNVNEPLFPTRVWLHMYEGPDGLTPNFDTTTGDANYMYDFTGFSEWRVEQNALLSDDAKCLMFKLSQQLPSFWTAERLAKVFRIRVQRALSIVKIKEREFENSDRCVRDLNRLQEIFGLPPTPQLHELHRPRSRYSTKHLSAWFEPWLQLYELLLRIIDPLSPGLTGAPEGAEDSAEAAAEEAAQPEEAQAVEGSEDAAAADEDDAAKVLDKRKSLSRTEALEVVDLHNRLAAAANSEARHIACHEDVWRCFYHFGSNEKHIPNIATFPAFEERPLGDSMATLDSATKFQTYVAETAVREDSQQIEDFQRNLAWSLGETGKSIQRMPRKRGEDGSTLPKKPPEGWPILVTPLHAGGHKGTSFVAQPDATRRDLTDDEQLYLQHFKREPRMFSRPRRHAPYTNSTLHMFQKRKPNDRHDLYNPKYEGSRTRKRQSGPTKRQQRLKRQAAREYQKDMDRKLSAARI